jgi:hypothetical protein
VSVHLDYLKITAYAFFYIFISRLHFSKDACIDCVLSSDQALHEALMRQEELLAYIDGQEEAKLRVG